MIIESFLRSALWANAEIAKSVMKTRNDDTRAQKLLAFIRESFIRKVLSTGWTVVEKRNRRLYKVNP